MQVERLAAFCDGDRGGNPAGVVIRDRLPDAHDMQRVAREVGYSETVFAAPLECKWRVRYFAPETEVPFCGHATIALGALFAARTGDAIHSLLLNDAEITVQGFGGGGSIGASLQSPRARSRPAATGVIDEALGLFGYVAADLDPRLAPAISSAGNDHLVLALGSRALLAQMDYDLSRGRAFMLGEGFTTVTFLHAEAPGLFHVRNAFASGGVLEDPATGSAAAALGGYLETEGWPVGDKIEIRQGEDMGVPCRIVIEVDDAAANGVRVSGRARFI